jgi:hypothetical protein
MYKMQGESETECNSHLRDGLVNTSSFLILAFPKFVTSQGRKITTVFICGSQIIHESSNTFAYNCEAESVWWQATDWETGFQFLQRLFSTPQGTHRLWVPSSYLSNSYGGGHIPGDKAAKARIWPSVQSSIGEGNVIPVTGREGP